MENKNTVNKLSIPVIAIVGGILGALSGADNSSKVYRRFLIPAILTSLAYYNTESILVITIMLMSLILGMGYGIPSHIDDIEDSSYDSGSFIGRFFYKITKQNHFLSDVLTRGLIGVLISLSLISIPILKNNGLIYSLGSLGIILTNSLLSWRNLGEYKLFNKELSWTETLNWGIIVLFSSLLIYLN